MTEEQISVRTHDNLDRDLIRVNKDKLHLLLLKNIESAVVPASAQSYIGFAITFGVTALLTESFHNIGFIPGETFRAVFIFGTIAATIQAIRLIIRWNNLKDDYSPEKIIERLTPNEPEQEILLLPSPGPTPAKKRYTRKQLSELSSQNLIKSKQEL